MQASRFSGLNAFAAVARHGGFSRAADVLGVSASALSQAVRQLEAEVGLRLFHRSTRQVRLSDAGEQFLAQVSPALAQLDSALETLHESRGHPCGRLRINASRLAIGLLIEPVLARFAATYPDIELDLHADDTLADLIGEGFDAGIRLGETLAQDVVARPVGPPQRMIVVGTPAYFLRHKPPTNLQALAEHACIRFRYPGSQRVMRWVFTDKRGHALELAVNGPLICNDDLTVRQAALAGVGLSLQFEQTVRADLQAGRLQHVLKAHMAEPEQFFIYYPAREHVPLKLRAFIDTLLTA